MNNNSTFPKVPKIAPKKLDINKLQGYTLICNQPSSVSSSISCTLRLVYGRDSTHRTSDFC